MDIVYQLSQQIQSSTISLLRTDLNKLINSDDDDNNLIDIPTLFSNDQLTTLLDYLRSLRQWAATIPDLLNNHNHSIEEINSCRKDVYNSLKSLLDSLFLCLFQKDQIISFWYSIPIMIQSNIILCISICIQVIINLLSESIQSIELFDIHSLFIILLSNNRPLICLTNYGLTLWNHYNDHSINHNRLSSHYAYLLYLLLLRIEQTINNHDKLPKLILQLLQNNFISNKTIIQSILEQSCNTIESNNDSIKIIHFQLLLIQLMKSFNQFIKLLSFNEIINQINIDFIHLIIDITGFVLLLISSNELTNQCELPMKSQRILPTNMKSCLGYWLAYLSMLDSSSSSFSHLMNDTMKILLNECSRLSSLWIKELIVYSPEKDAVIPVNNNTVSLLVNSINISCLELFS